MNEPVNGDDGPDVIPSTVDPDVECVRIGSAAHGGGVAAIPPGGAAPVAEGPCPPGYVPRRRRRHYGGEGKRVVTGEPPERNPESTELHDD